MPYLRSAPTTYSGADEQSLVLRRATGADARALTRLAALDDAAPLSGEILVAEQDGEIVAAHELGGSRSIADPFRPTARYVRLLRAHCRALHATGRGALPIRARRSTRRLLAH